MKNKKKNLVIEKGQVTFLDKAPEIEENSKIASEIHKEDDKPNWYKENMALVEKGITDVKELIKKNNEIAAELERMGIAKKKFLGDELMLQNE